MSARLNGEGGVGVDLGFCCDGLVHKDWGLCLHCFHDGMAPSVTMAIVFGGALVGATVSSIYMFSAFVATV